MTDHLVYFLIGFIAQLFDGVLGMGYGVVSSSLLLSTGLTPLAASSTVHFSEIFTTGMSAYWHSKFGNVDKALFKKLVIPGAIGGILGAYILTQVPGEGLLKALVSVYLLVMSVRIILKSLNKTTSLAPLKKIAPLGFVGGFFDAIGGGGWGPIVTATLFGRGHKTHIVIGSVNAAEFIVTLCQSATFVTMIGLVHLDITMALVLGGALSAPAGAFLCRKYASKNAGLAIGGFNSIISVHTLYRSILGLLH
jgi:uncharacterized membrane protein YfcA